MGFAMNWRSIARKLLPGSLSLAFDQRGHGKSIKPEHGYAPQDYAQDLRLIIDELGWDRFHLVGHSMGARNALVFADLFAERVRSLTMVDLGPEARPESIQYYEGLLAAIPTPFENKQAAKAWFMNEFVRLKFAGKKPQGLALYLYSNIEEKPGGLADWRFSKAAMLESVRKGRAEDHWRAWEGLKMPTLIIRGEESSDLTREVYLEMLNRNSSARGLEIARAGHWVHSDQPEQFTQALNQFMNEVEALERNL
jgi:pimeloyl-ACP methyl ester carboxylesterase